jgi:Flp pilus assembly protein TadD
MNYLLILLFSVVAQQSELTAGKAFYRSGEFKQAAAHFQLALQTDPLNGESHYWLGRSYETLADIATPFGRKYRLLAGAHLAKAAELAPGQAEYRRELFEFLLDSGDLRQAAAILLRTAESDPDYDSMLARLEETKRLNASLKGRVNKVFQVATAWR